MEHKVLIADDSLTIQKVIKITLSNEPFELSECSNPDELTSVVKDAGPEIVLLDFNLSENKTGYDLCREIKQINPQIGVLMLFGTFDTIDEELLLECGCNYHIVKPFDGNKFINLCRALAQDFQSASGEETSSPASTKGPPQAEPPMESESDFGEDDWVMNQPHFEEPEEPEEPEEQESNAPHFEQNDLAKEVEEWGMEVPSIIGSQEPGSPEIPDIISMEAESQEFEMQDLEDQTSEGFEVPDQLKPESLDADSSEQTQEIEVDEIDDDSGIELDSFEPESTGTETEEELNHIKSQIDEGPEENELWAADVVEPPTPEDESEAEEFSAMNPSDFDHVDEVKEEDVPEDFPAAIGGSEESEDSEEASPQVNSIVESTVQNTENISDKIQEELEAQLGAKLSPLVEKYVKDYCREQIERVAWEVIPDLAENIIKKEIQKISDSILDQ